VEYPFEKILEVLVPLQRGSAVDLLTELETLPAFHVELLQVNFLLVSLKYERETMEQQIV
jgi:hypothetical protein